MERDKLKKRCEDLEDVIRQKEMEITQVKNMASTKEQQMIQEIENHKGNINQLKQSQAQDKDTLSRLNVSLQQANQEITRTKDELGRY